MTIPEEIAGFKVVGYVELTERERASWPSESGVRVARVRPERLDDVHARASTVDSPGVLDLLDELVQSDATERVGRESPSALAIVQADDLYAVHELDSAGEPIDDEWWFTSLSAAKDFASGLVWMEP